MPTKTEGPLTERRSGKSSNVGRELRIFNPNPAYKCLLFVAAQQLVFKKSVYYICIRVHGQGIQLLPTKNVSLLSKM